MAKLLKSYFPFKAFLFGPVRGPDCTRITLYETLRHKSQQWLREACGHQARRKSIDLYITGYSILKCMNSVLAYWLEGFGIRKSFDDVQPSRYFVLGNMDITCHCCVGSKVGKTSVFY